MSRGGCHDYDEIWKAVREKGFLTTMLEFYGKFVGKFDRDAQQRAPSLNDANTFR